jgi:hypothetical protein
LFTRCSDGHLAYEQPSKVLGQQGAPRKCDASTGLRLLVPP